jgi:hypothetical protein
MQRLQVLRKAQPKNVSRQKTAIMGDCIVDLQILLILTSQANF